MRSEKVRALRCHLSRCVTSSRLAENFAVYKGWDFDSSTLARVATTNDVTAPSSICSRRSLFEGLDIVGTRGTSSYLLEHGSNYASIRDEMLGLLLFLSIAGSLI